MQLLIDMLLALGDGRTYDEGCDRLNLPAAQTVFPPSPESINRHWGQLIDPATASRRQVLIGSARSDS